MGLVMQNIYFSIANKTKQLGKIESSKVAILALCKKDTL